MYKHKSEKELQYKKETDSKKIAEIYNRNSTAFAFIF